MAAELAEILHDLLSVRAIAIPGALVQMAVATLLGMALAWGFGWKLGADLVFGLALSVASTVVLLRALQERRLVDTEQGRIAIGWLIVQDLAMVLALVLLPPVAGLLGGTGEAAMTADTREIATALGITFAKVAAFVALMLLVGRQVIPRVLHYVAHTGSRELFRLAVLSLALGVAYGATELFGVSFALGAPAWCLPNPSSATGRPRSRCRSATPSLSSSSSRSGCCSTRPSWCANRGR